MAQRLKKAPEKSIILRARLPDCGECQAVHTSMYTLVNTV